MKKLEELLETLINEARMDNEYDNGRRLKEAKKAVEDYVSRLTGSEKAVLS